MGSILIKIFSKPKHHSMDRKYLNLSILIFRYNNDIFKMIYICNLNL